MKKLLVNTPSGAQEILTVGEGGCYFDASRVIWDERINGELPDITVGGMISNGDALVFDQSRMDHHIAALAPPVPASVSPRQIRQALTRAGLRAQVEAAVAAGDQDLKDWWEFSTQFERINSQVTAMGAALGVTELQLDELWTLAGSL